MIVHEVVQKDTRKYYHRILKYSMNWDLVEISVPFFMKKFFVEFTLSCMIDEEKQEFIIPYSTRDNTTEILYINLQKILWIPHDVKKWMKDNQLML